MTPEPVQPRPARCRPGRGLPTRTALLVAAAAILLAGTGCTPPPAPPVHPLGRSCTWPADIDLTRDQLAILINPQSDAAGQAAITLIHLPTSTIRAVCGGIRPAAWNVVLDPDPDGTEYSIGRGREINSRVLSPDYHYAVTPGGVTELTTGTLIPNPDPVWVAVGLPGHGAVLRQHVNTNDHSVSSELPSNFCLAPRFDAPQTDCRPLDGTGNGLPAVHTDGTVGWAPAIAVPTTFTGPAGETYTGIVQTDGTNVIQARVDEARFVPESGHPVMSAESVPIWTERPYLNDHAAMIDASVSSLNPTYNNRFVWYSMDTLTPTSASGTLHSPQPGRAAPGDPYDGELAFGNAVIIDNNQAAVLQYTGLTSYEPRLVFVRIDLDGTLTELARIPRPEPESDDGVFPLGEGVRPYAWPDTTPGTAAP